MAIVICYCCDIAVAAGRRARVFAGLIFRRGLSGPICPEPRAAKGNSSHQRGSAASMFVDVFVLGIKVWLCARAHGVVISGSRSSM